MDTNIYNKPSKIKYHNQTEGEKENMIKITNVTKAVTKAFKLKKLSKPSLHMSNKELDNYITEQKERYFSTNTALESHNDIKTVKLSKVKIFTSMEEHLPNTKNFASKYSYYKKNKRFYSLIMIDKHYNLIDGYTTYLLAKMLGIDYAKVLILR